MTAPVTCAAICDNCGGTGELIKFNAHGCGVCAARTGIEKLPNWCETCVVKAQIAYAEPIAASLPELRIKLAALLAPRAEGA